MDLGTDPDHCGGCGQSCRGDSCETGFCEVVVLASTIHPVALALDSENVYWASGGAAPGSSADGSVGAIKKAGGPAVDKRAVEIAKPIKNLGPHTVGIKLHDAVTAHVPLTVVKA